MPRVTYKNDETAIVGRWLKTDTLGNTDLLLLLGSVAKPPTPLQFRQYRAQVALVIAGYVKGRLLPGGETDDPRRALILLSLQHVDYEGLAQSWIDGMRAKGPEGLCAAAEAV